MLFRSINLYLGCEVAGGGFSTTTGTIMRYNIVDTAAPAQNPMFDFPLHDAGDFDAVTNLWVHFVLGVTTTGMKTWDDGMPVPDGGCTEASVGSAACPYHFYNDAATMAADPAYPKPSQLNPVAPGYDFGDDSIHLGARADHDPNRHFRGKMALVNVYDYAVSDVQAECMFRGGDAALPDPSAIYSSSGCAPLEVDISFIGDISDRSGNGHVVTLRGGASVSMDGLHVDGQGQWAEIPHFDYADDGHFSIAFWMTKEACSGGIYEYLYSHAQVDGGVIDDVTNSNINMYIGCETSGGAWSSASSGTNLRYNLVDSAQTWAMFDFPLHDAGDFDAITNLWIHVVLVVSGTRLVTYDDGMPVSDDVYGYYTGGGVTVAANVAYRSEEHTSELQSPI